MTQRNAHLDAWVYCPHGPNDGCDCRKPKAGLLKTLLQCFSIDTNNAVLIGDSLRDLQAAQRIAMDAILVKTGKGRQTLRKNKISVPVYDDLAAAVEILIDE